MSERHRLSRDELGQDGPPVRVRDVAPPWVKPEWMPLPAEWPQGLLSRLRRNGVETWQQLEQLTQARFLSWSGCGSEALANIRTLCREANRFIHVESSITAKAMPSMVMSVISDGLPKHSRSGVYFIQSGPFIKVGISAHVVHRLESFATANPYELKGLGWIPAEDEACVLESELHRRFAGHRHRGEWFHWCQEIADYIAEHAEPWPKDARTW